MLIEQAEVAVNQNAEAFQARSCAVAMGVKSREQPFLIPIDVGNGLAARADGHRLKRISSGADKFSCGDMRRRQDLRKTPTERRLSSAMNAANENDALVHGDIPDRLNIGRATPFPI